MSPEVAHAFGATDWNSVLLSTTALMGGAAFLSIAALKPLRRAVIKEPRWRTATDFFPYSDIWPNGRCLRSESNRFTAVIELQGGDTSFGDENTKKQLSTTVINWLNSLAGQNAQVDYYTFRTEEAPLAPVSTGIEEIDALLVPMRNIAGIHHRNSTYIALTSTRVGDAGRKDVEGMINKAAGRLHQLGAKVLTQADSSLGAFVGLLGSPITRPVIGGTGHNLASAACVDKAKIDWKRGYIRYTKGDRSLYGAIYSITGLSGNPDRGLMQRILNLPYSLTVHHRISVKGPAASHTHITAHRSSNVSNMYDNNVTNEFDASQSRLSGASEHHRALTDCGFSVMVYGRTADELAEIEDAIVKAAGQYSIVREETLFRRSFFSMFPPHAANRRAQIRHTDFCEHLMQFIRSPRGDDGSAWLAGRAMDYFPTVDGSLYRFNFHIAQRHANDHMPPAHGMIVGGTGGGKTTLAARLALIAKQNPDMEVIFLDADYGMYILASAVGATYQTLEPGTSLINIAQGPANDDNRSLLRNALRAIIGRDDPATLDEIEFAVRMNFHPNTRMESQNLRHLLNTCFLKREGHHAYDALRRFLDNPKQGGLVTAERDGFSFGNTGFNVINFAKLKDDPVLAAVIILYFLHKTLERIEKFGKRVLLVVDEAASALRIPAFRPFVQQAYERFRKLGSAIWTLFQTPKQIIESHIDAELLQLATTKIYIPNTLADEDDYGIFDLPPTVFRAIKDPKNYAPGIDFGAVAQRPEHIVFLNVDMRHIGKENLRLFQGGAAATEFMEIQKKAATTQDAITLWRQAA